jgi:hypothetical protein
MSATHLKVVAKPQSKSAARREQLRDALWPDAQSLVWNRKKEKGFCTIPRTLALILTLIDHLQKGKDASRVYFDLWCRAFDDYLVEVPDEEIFAYSAGYMSGRSVRTWRERINVLERYGFIRVESSGTKRYANILIPDPHKVVKTLHEQGHVPKNWWAAFNQRAAEIGCVLP